MRAMVIAVIVFMLTVALDAQAPAPVAQSASVSQETADAYSYGAEGRRDPFVSLMGASSDAKGAIPRRADGAAAFAVGEISVRGIMQSRNALVAMVQGPDNKTYLIHQGDKFADGVVKSVTAQGLVVVQDISDPLSIQKRREVRKLLRSLEDVKE